MTNREKRVFATHGREKMQKMANFIDFWHFLKNTNFSKFLFYRPIYIMKKYTIKHLRPKRKNQKMKNAKMAKNTQKKSDAPLCTLLQNGGSKENPLKKLILDYLLPKDAARQLKEKEANAKVEIPWFINDGAETISELLPFILKSEFFNPKIKSSYTMNPKKREEMINKMFSGKFISDKEIQDNKERKLFEQYMKNKLCDQLKNKINNDTINIIKGNNKKGGRRQTRIKRTCRINKNKKTIKKN